MNTLIYLLIKMIFLRILYIKVLDMKYIIVYMFMFSVQIWKL